MNPPLLDASALIALVIKEHVDHTVMATWTASAGLVAVCPIVEGALVRFLVRSGQSGTTARHLLHAIHSEPRYVFWADDLSYADTDLAHVVGHRQVTDAYLAALARHHDTVLVTLDKALAATIPDATLLIDGER